MPFDNAANTSALFDMLFEPGGVQEMSSSFEIALLMLMPEDSTTLMSYATLSEPFPTLQARVFFSQILLVYWKLLGHI